MSESAFRVYMARNGYINVQIRRLKRVDIVSYETTEATGYPNVRKVIVTLKKHIEEILPQNYNHIAISLDERQKWV